MLRHSHTTPTLSLHQLQKHLANSFKDHFCHSAGHLVLHSAAPRVATRLCASSPLGRPARHHSVAHVFITRPPRASPLGCVRLHHSAAPRIATWFCTSSPLARPARRHSVLHVFTTRPPRASPLGYTRPRPSAAPRVTISWTCLYLYTPSTGTAKLLIWSNLISHSVASLPPSSITRGLRAAVGHVTLRGYAHLVNLLITSRYSSDHTCSVRRRSISEARPLG